MKIVFASNNQNKIKEIQSLLPKEIQIVSLQDINCIAEIEETAATIEGNAILKANYVTEKYGYDCFADDSGLEIESLNGEPGVYSARYAGEPKNDNNNIEKVLEKLKGKNNRKANFKTVICLNLNGVQVLFTGLVDGQIGLKRVGNNGFGYDSIFISNGMTKTFAELTMQEKASISHRGEAIKLLVNYLKKSNQI